MPRLSDFLKELAKPEEAQSHVRDLWHHRDREDAMEEYGLSDDQKDKIRRALDTEDLEEVRQACADEAEEEGEQSTKAKVFLWVK
jgi:hypothetical protein